MLKGQVKQLSDYIKQKIDEKSTTGHIGQALDPEDARSVFMRY